MRRLSVVLLVALAVVGCKKKEPAPQQAAAPSVEGATSIKGKVLERLDAPPYSYLRLKTEQGETWAAVPKAETEKGADVVVSGAMPMTEFESKTLKRKFDVVYFGTLAGPGAPPAGEAAAGGPPPNMAAQ